MPVSTREDTYKVCERATHCYKMRISRQVPIYLSAPCLPKRLSAMGDLIKTMVLVTRLPHFLEATLDDRPKQQLYSHKCPPRPMMCLTSELVENPEVQHHCNCLLLLLPVDILDNSPCSIVLTVGRAVRCVLQSSELVFRHIRVWSRLWPTRDVVVS